MIRSTESLRAVTTLTQRTPRILTWRVAHEEAVEPIAPGRDTSPLVKSAAICAGKRLYGRRGLREVDGQDGDQTVCGCRRDTWSRSVLPAFGGSVSPFESGFVALRCSRVLAWTFFDRDRCIFSLMVAGGLGHSWADCVLTFVKVAQVILTKRRSIG